MTDLVNHVQYVKMLSKSPRLGVGMRFSARTVKNNMTNTFSLTGSAHLRVGYWNEESKDPIEVGTISAAVSATRH